MKQWKRLCAALLSGLLLTGSALAAGETVQVLQNVRFEASTATENQGKYTVTVTNDAIQNGKDYALLIAKGTIPANAEVGGTMAMPTIDSTTLTYIDQTTATLVDSKPTVTFENFIPKSVPNSVVLLGGNFANGVESPVVIGFINGQGVLINFNLGVSGATSASIISGTQIKIFDDTAQAVQIVEQTDGIFKATNIAAGTYYAKAIKPYCISVPVKVIVEDEDLDSVTSIVIPGDVDSSGTITLLDLNNILIDYNKTADYTESSDIDGSGGVTMLDLNYILANFNKSDISIEDFIAGE